MDRDYKKMLELLLRSLDQELLPSEAQQLKTALVSSEKLRQEKDRLIQVRQQLQDWQPAVDEDFTARVMVQISQQLEEDLTAVIVRLFPRVAAACVVVLCVALGAIYLTEGSLMVETIIGVNEVMPEDALILVENGF